eukprot:TRINITY_DN3569_c0_g3_i4.p1 TRINITY_DN3569_c0_g3~~TRINITY_DN3569_c0_g3_i4.p1  ORF type:complete len:1437 (-),score=160.98 TRINITY_DN3569_c0_g3_i4:134-4444(-)
MFLDCDGVYFFVLILSVRADRGAFEDTSEDWRKHPPPIWSDSSVPWNIDPYEWDNDMVMVNVTVDTHQVGAGQTQYNFGLNTPAYVPRKFYNDFAVDILKEGGFKFLRWPGGSIADDYIWHFRYAHYPWFEGRARGRSDGFFDTDDFILLCKQTGAEPIVQANVAVFAIYGLEAGGNLAVEWLKHFQNNGVKARYWTLGNQNWRNAETPNKHEEFRVTGKMYTKYFKHLKTVLTNVDSQIFVGPVVSPTDDQVETRNWMRELGPLFNEGAADFVDVNHYFMQLTNPYEVPQTEDIYRENNNSKIRVLVENVTNMTKFYGSTNRSLPIALTEWNTAYLFPRADDTPDQIISALAVADLVTTMSQGSGIRANAYFAFSDVFLSRYLTPRRTPGDLGLVTRNDPNAVDGTPRPAWYAYVMLNKLVGDLQHSAYVTDGPANYAKNSMSAGKWVHAAPLVQARAWKFSASGEVSVMLINRNAPDNKQEAIAVCLRNIGVQPGNRVRGWVLSPGDIYASEPVRTKSVRWNGHSGNFSIGGPFPLEYIPAMSVDTSSPPPGCDAKAIVPPSSIVGLIFYTESSKEILTPVPRKQAPAKLELLLNDLMDPNSLTFFYTVFGGVTLVYALVSAMAVCVCSRAPPPPAVDSRLSQDERMARDVPWRSLFDVRPFNTFLFLLVIYLDATYLVWLPLRAWRDGVEWFGILYLFVEFIASLSSAAYYVCSCFEPKPLKADNDWTHDDTDGMLNFKARTVRAAIVQCHYNEPLAEIAYSLRCNLRYFRDLGFSRESRPYYICDDGFFTGTGRERTKRQRAFCDGLRQVVHDVFGKPGFEIGEEDEPLALKEGTHVENVWRPDCANGFLIWSIGNASDHVYLVAREKPRPHHSKAGNINNFLYNVLQFEYGAGNNPLAPPSYMLVLDQDMCLGHDFIASHPDYRPVEIIAQSLPVFESDLKRTCFVQCPQHFRDLHEMDVTFNSNATFYKAVQIGRGAVGMASFAGTNCVWDISKLMSLGGIQYGSVTEDSNTSIIAHKHGLRSRFIDMPVAAGNSPQTVDDAIKQVCARWAKGAVDMLLQRCCRRSHPERLVDDMYRVPPDGLCDAYGRDRWAHFRTGADRQFRSQFFEAALRKVFCFETMVFPFWSLTALAHSFLACWLLITMKPPVSVSNKFEYSIIVAHVFLKLLYPIFAFPKVRVVEIWYSMAAWLGLAPTMLTHAILSSFKQRLCPCLGTGQWTSIGGRATRFSRSQMYICILVAALCSLSIYRGVICYLAPDVPRRTCPVIDTNQTVSGTLPFGAQYDNFDCDFTRGAGGLIGDTCGFDQDDSTSTYCYCCCKYSGQCGYEGSVKTDSFRPVDSEPPCDGALTFGAEMYAAMLIVLGMPWVFAVGRDSRRYRYVEGVHGEVRASNMEILQHESHATVLRNDATLLRSDKSGISSGISMALLPRQ